MEGLATIPVVEHNGITAHLRLTSHLREWWGERLAKAK